MQTRSPGCKGIGQFVWERTCTSGGTHFSGKRNALEHQRQITGISHSQLLADNFTCMRPVFRYGEIFFALRFRWNVGDCRQTTMSAVPFSCGMIENSLLSAIRSTDTICSSKLTTRSNSQKICPLRSRANVRTNPAAGALKLEPSRKNPDAPRIKDVNVNMALENASQICNVRQRRQIKFLAFRIVTVLAAQEAMDILLLISSNVANS
jgi:hypothetical protein